MLAVGHEEALCMKRIEEGALFFVLAIFYFNDLGKEHIESIIPNLFNIIRRKNECVSPLLKMLIVKISHLLSWEQMGNFNIIG